MWLQALVIGSLLPIWRYPPQQGGYNLWQLLQFRDEPRPHITSEEAIENARLAREQGYFNTAGIA